MMTVFAVALPKGGATKTTIAAELVASLARQGRSVLAVDLDKQGNLSTRLGVTAETVDTNENTAGYLLGRSSLARSWVPSPHWPHVSVLVGDAEMRKVSTTSVPDLITALRDDLARLVGQIDDVVIDTPPAPDELILCATAAADRIIAPVAIEVEALDQVQQLADLMQERLNARIKPDGAQIAYVIPTRFDARRSLDRQILEALTEAYGDLITAPVREAVAVKESYAAAMPVSLYAADAAVTQDLMTIMDTITRDKADRG